MRIDNATGNLASLTGSFNGSASLTGSFSGSLRGSNASIISTTDKRYVTDANLTVIGNTSGSNTGNNAINTLYSGLVSNATHTGDVTGSTVLTIGPKKVTLAMMADGVDGELITYDANGVAAKVAVGTAGQTLTSNGPGQPPTFQNNGVTLTKTIVIEYPTNTEDICFWFTPVAITITEVRGVIVGSGYVTIDPDHSTSRSAGGNDIFGSPNIVSSTTAGDTWTSLQDATVPANSWIRMKTTSVSGAPTQLTVTFTYTED